MAFDFSKAITRETNTLVNKAINSTIKSVGTAVNKGAGDFVKKETEGLLNKIGAPPAIRQAIRSISGGFISDVVNSATGLVEDIISGAFTNDSLKKLSSMDAVTAGVKRNDPTAKKVNDLNVLAGAAADVTKRVSTPGVITSSSASPYAVDFADNFTPKFKFLFLADIIFNDPFNVWQDTFGFGGNQFQTVIHKFDRPKVDIEHDEVNLYNFTTHVPKLIKYHPASFTAHDDETNHTLRTLVSYLKVISPIMKSHSTGSSSYEYGEHAMQGNPHGTPEGKQNSSNFSTIQQSFNTLEENFQTGNQESITSIIKEIKIYHVYDFGSKVDTYRFFNPKFTSIEMDSFDMSESSTTSVKFDFVYDAMHIDIGLSPNDKSITNFAVLNSGAKYNLVNRDVEQVRKNQDDDFERAYKAQEADRLREENRIKDQRELKEERQRDFAEFEQGYGLDPNDEYARAQMIEEYNTLKQQRQNLAELTELNKVSAQHNINNRMLAEDLYVLTGPINSTVTVNGLPVRTDDQTRKRDAKMMQKSLETHRLTAATLPSVPSASVVANLSANIRQKTTYS